MVQSYSFGQVNNPHFNRYYSTLLSRSYKLSSVCPWVVYMKSKTLSWPCAKFSIFDGVTPKSRREQSSTGTRLIRLETKYNSTLAEGPLAEWGSEKGKQVQWWFQYQTRPDFKWSKSAVCLRVLYSIHDLNIRLISAALFIWWLDQRTEMTLRTFEYWAMSLFIPTLWLNYWINSLALYFTFSF